MWATRKSSLIDWHIFRLFSPPVGLFWVRLGEQNIQRGRRGVLVFVGKCSDCFKGQEMANSFSASPFFLLFFPILSFLGMSCDSSNQTLCIGFYYHYLFIPRRKRIIQTRMEKFLPKWRWNVYYHLIIDLFHSRHTFHETKILLRNLDLFILL